MAHNFVAENCTPWQAPIAPRPQLTLVTPETPIDPKAQINKFRMYMMVMRGLGKGTADNYCRITAKALRDLCVVMPTHEQVTAYIYQLHTQRLSASHIANVSRAMEAYTQFVGNPIKLGRPRKPKPILHDTLSEAEIAVILAACKNTREKAIIALLAYSGARNKELCDLVTQDVDCTGNTVQVANGKGSKGRVVCIAGECAQAVLDYLRDYPRQSDSRLFTTLRHGHPYSEYALRRRVKTVVARTLIKKRVHPHLFRHSLATNMLARGANLLTIQQLLGHAYIDTTMLYVRSKPKRVQAEYNMFCPSYL